MCACGRTAGAKRQCNGPPVWSVGSEPRGGAPISTERPASLAECALLIVERNPLTQSIIEATVEDDYARPPMENQNIVPDVVP